MLAHAQVRPATAITWPSEDDVAESVLHLLLRTFLLALVRRWLALNGIRAFAGSEQFIYWVPGNPQRTLAPDLYVLFGVAPDRLFRSWKVWEEGVVPRFAVEIVSDDLGKDYLLAPRRYAELGVEELVIFDPECEQSPDRVRWQVYRQDGGELVLAERTDADRVVSRVLGCHLRWMDGVVRLAAGASGDDVIPTAEEQERAAKEQERERRLELEAEVEELRRKLSGR